MAENSLKNYILITFLAIFSLFLLYELIIPLIYSIFLTYFLSPFYYRLYRQGLDENFSSLFTITLFFLLILCPLFILFYIALYNSISFLITNSIYLSNPEILHEAITNYLLTEFNIQTTFNFTNVIISFGNTIVNIVQGITLAIPTFALDLFITLFITYYLLINRDYLIHRVYMHAPIPDEHITFLLYHLKSIMNVLIKGYVYTGFVQAISALPIYIYLQVPYVLLITFLTFVTSLFPYIGTPLIWVPLSMFFYFTGNVYAAVILMLYGVIVISSVDNLVRPFLMSKEGVASPIIVFLGLLGGASLFGIIGLFIGPLVLSLTVSYINVYYKKYHT